MPSALFRRLPELPRLRSLETYTPQDVAPADAMAVLAAMPAIEKFRAHRSEFTRKPGVREQALLQPLSRDVLLPNLTDLQAPPCDASLLRIRMPALTRLEMHNQAGFRFSSAQFKQLAAGMPRLRRLALNGEGLAYCLPDALPELKGVQKLTLDFTSCSSALLSRMAKPEILPQLHTLRIHEETAYERRALQDTKIVVPLVNAHPTLTSLNLAMRHSEWDALFDSPLLDPKRLPTLRVTFFPVRLTSS